MKISNYIEKMENLECWKVINEQDVDILMLSESRCKKRACIFIDNPKFISSIPENVCMVLTTKELENEIVCEGRGAIITAHPRLLFFALHNYLAKNPEYSGVKFESKIDPSAMVSSLADISKHNVIVGKNVVIESFVMIYPDTVIGDNCIIRAGAVIGGCGFEFKRDGDSIASVEHCGGVRIGDHVEIQNNSCIDRAIYPWDDTEIGDYTKIDNLVHVAHAVKIDKNVMIVANTGIGGRVEIKENSWIGFGATIRNGLVIGNNARANMGAVVTKDIPANTAVTGNFAVEHKVFMEHLKNMNR